MGGGGGGGGCVRSLFCYAVLCVVSRFAIISLVKRELVALVLLSSGYHVAGIILCLFFTVTWVGLHCVIFAFPDHSHF